MVSCGGLGDFFSDMFCSLIGSMSVNVVAEFAKVPSLSPSPTTCPKITDPNLTPP